ncbi:MAG TPA: NUDIX domain-containing protein [Erysipelotrichaceae bacterium]|nr:NUDIX domain-containing protein [Erysipelotrichaceae bacterium]
MKHVVIGLIYDNHKLCVAKRLSEPYLGYIECPGGKVEVNESLEDALKRELFEEVNLLLFNHQFLKSITVENEYGIFVLHFYKIIPYQELTPKVYNELFWVDKSTIKQLNWIPHNLPYLDFFISAD